MIAALLPAVVCVMLLTPGRAEARTVLKAMLWTDGDADVGQPMSNVNAVLDGDKVVITYDLDFLSDVWVLGDNNYGASCCGVFQGVEGDVGNEVTPCFCTTAISTEHSIIFPASREATNGATSP